MAETKGDPFAQYAVGNPTKTKQTDNGSVENVDYAKTSESSRLQLTTATLYSPGLRNFLLYSPLPATLPTYRSIGWDPVVGVAMDYIISTIASAGETVESDPGCPDEICDFIHNQWQDLKFQCLSLAVRDIYRYGWSSFEKIWFVDDNGYVICRLKQLEAQITGLLVEPHTGALQGVVQPLVLGMANSPAVGWPVMLDTDHALLFSWMPEGSVWYGTSTFERIRTVYNDFNEANEGAKRYDKYIAGSHFVIYYPDRTNVNMNGVEMTAAEAANQLLESLESSGALTIPAPIRAVIGQLEDQTQGGWKVEILSDSTPRQPSFMDRLKYLDVAKVRGLGLTERSMFESSTGTRADAGTHQDVVHSILEWRHAFLINEISKQVIDPLLEQNFGPEYKGTVRIQTTPIQKENVAVAAEVYKAILAAEAGPDTTPDTTTPDGKVIPGKAIEKKTNELAMIDMGALRELLNIPSLDVDDGGETQVGGGDSDLTEKANQDDSVVVGVVQATNP